MCSAVCRQGLSLFLEAFSLPTLTCSLASLRHDVFDLVFRQRDAELASTEILL